MTEPKGPLERIAWPEHLTARVVTPGPRPRVHGYDVEGDLCRHYGFAESVLLALTGEPPDRSRGRAFEIALAMWMPVSIDEAPAHAAALARLCGARTGAVVSTGATVLAEQSRWVVEEHRDLLAWLGDPAGPLPGRHRSAGADDDGAVARLREALAPTGVSVPALEAAPTRTAAVLATLHAIGLREPARIEVALTLARLACVAAEALEVEPGKLRDYPMNLPRFEYRDPP